MVKKMKKKIILLGAFMSTCIILMVSSASAVEYRAVVDHNTNEIISEIGNGKINTIAEKWISTFQKMKLNFNNLKTTNDINILLEKLTELKSTINNTPQPAYFHLILRFIMRLISIIKTIFGIIGTILILILKIIRAPAILFVRLITVFIHLIRFDIH